MYIIHKELWERMVTEMLIVFLSERWISGDFYFFLKVLFDFFFIVAFVNEYVQFIWEGKHNRLFFIVGRKKWDKCLKLYAQIGKPHLLFINSKNL